MTDFERTGMLNKFHQEHGKFEDVSDEELKKDRDNANKAQFLADVALTEEEARNHPPMTESRKAYFVDHIDDILRGDTTAEQLPPDIAKTIALLLSDYPDPPIEKPTSKITDEPTVEKITTEQFKEKFMISPKTEERDITDNELDNLLEGFDKKKEKPNYIQNEEQNKKTLWQKTKDLDLPEPEKNKLDIPEIENTVDTPLDIADKITVESIIPQPKFTKHKNRLANDEEYRQRIEARINDLITKLENEEVKLNDLTTDDQQVIIDILNQNG